MRYANIILWLFHVAWTFYFVVLHVRSSFIIGWMISKADRHNFRPRYSWCISYRWAPVNLRDMCFITITPFVPMGLAPYTLRYLPFFLGMLEGYCHVQQFFYLYCRCLSCLLSLPDREEEEGKWFLLLYWKSDTLVTVWLTYYGSNFNYYAWVDWKV